VTQLARFIGGAVAAEAGLTAMEVADALWLAAHMEGFHSPPDPGQPGDGPRHRSGGRLGDKDLSSEGTDAGEKVPLLHSDPARNAALALAQETLPVGLPSPRELRGPLNLQRGLRPLKRTVGTGRTAVLDEAATAALSASAGAVIPALTSARERWLDLALVIDNSPSMILWRDLASELHVLLEQLGAFRAIRVWNVRFDADNKPFILPEGGGGAPRPANELIDPAGRQAILVITDCVADAWWPKSGSAGEPLKTWGQSGPLAIVQPLPRRMWARSAGPSRNVRLRSPFPGAPNGRLLVDQPGALPARSQDGVPVPVLEIERYWFESWSRLVSGTNPESLVAIFAGESAPEADPGRSQRLNPTQDKLEQARELVDQFNSVASPEAIRLAGLLAAAPLTLPMMRHIQRVMCMDQRPALLAEVFLSGLLLDVTPAGQRTTTFAYRPHVANLLLSAIRRPEANRIRELVSDELSNGLELSQARYVAQVPAKGGGTVVLTADEAYGEIDANVLRRFGGPYAQVSPVTDARPMSAKDGPLPGGDSAVAVAPEAPAPEETVPEKTVLEDAVLDRPAAAPVPSRVSKLADVAAGTTEIVMLGARESGKTTFLAALSIALLRRPSWRMIATDRASAQELERRVLDLTRDRTFPQATEPGVFSYQWRINGEVDQVVRGFLGRRRVRSREVSVDLSVKDAPGEIFERESLADDRADLVDALARGRGIILLLDPTREFEHGDTFLYVQRAVTLLRQRMLGQGASSTDRLQHYVAVCVSKFDEDRVFRSAERMKFVRYDIDDPLKFPRVADMDAREFLRQLCELRPGDTTELALATLERNFRPERIRYFVTSAIGFNVNRRTRVFDPNDRSNYVMGEPGGQVRIRGAIYPINVAEPLLWLSGRLADKQWDVVTGGA
jgi:hypothetical protein